MPATSDAVVDSISIAKELIDLKRYPIAVKGTAEYNALIEKCRAQLAKLGACVLPGFVTSEATSKLAQEARELAPLAFHNEVTGNAYLTEIDESVEKDDPRRKVDTTSLGAVAYDQMPRDAKIRAIYEWDTFMEFLSDCLGKERLYRYADPMGALNIAVMKKGDHLRWHFDQTDFVTSLLLQGSEGGEYEFVPMIRNNINENYPQVKAILNGSREGVIKLDIEPGSLVLFEGRNSLHRVTKVEGETMRLIALFGFDTKPGVNSSDYLRRIRYGRTEPIQQK